LDPGGVVVLNDPPAGPSGEKYILAEDIPAGHIEPDTPMPPASVTAPGRGVIENKHATDVESRRVLAYA
jgi:hypothetical protein